MNLQRFRQIVDTYGAAPQCWPAEERQAALQLLQTEAQARQLQQQALFLDTLLDESRVPQVSAHLCQRILTTVQSGVRAAPVREPALDILSWLYAKLVGDTLLQHILRPAMALGLPLALGLWLGMQTGMDKQGEQFAEQMMQAEFAYLLDSEQQDMTEWLQWLSS